MNIEELPLLLSRLEAQERERASVIQRLEGRAEEQEAVRAMVLEISTVLADLMQALEKSAPETAQAIANGLKNLKLTVAAPPVNVDAPVTVNLPPAPAPVIHLIEKAGKKPGGWRFDIDTDNFGNIKSMTATPL